MSTLVGLLWYLADQRLPWRLQLYTGTHIPEAEPHLNSLSSVPDMTGEVLWLHPAPFQDSCLSTIAKPSSERYSLNVPVCVSGMKELEPRLEDSMQTFVFVPLLLMPLYCNCCRMW